MRRALVPSMLLAASLLCPPVAAGQTPGPQARLWDAAIAGDTSAMARALREGAAIDSLDTRRNQGRGPNGTSGTRTGPRPLDDQVPAIRFLLAHRPQGDEARTVRDPALRSRGGEQRSP